MSNLNEILARNTVVNPDELVKRSVSWTYIGAAGETVSDTADVFIIANVSFAASDRIYLGDARFPKSSRQSRAISERVRFGTNGTETMDYEQAELLRPELGWALANAILQLDKERSPVAPSKEGATDEVKE